MLDKNDKKEMKQLIVDSLIEFYEKMIEPNFNRYDKYFGEIKNRFDEQDKEIDIMQRKLDRNRVEHDEIFEKFGQIDGHEKRIKKIEKVVTTS